ncbi:pyruvate ferredoxin/flavodoxin oxidoreductase [Alkaliphilus metalliredigens QYMF]|uniref:Pyruvate ferredoxin/flavodoxin oxidoreductase n=1 Tax=Alkaliphilus metalliredigens (strain QYMF) TaxID=293826 RepID=A6TNR9_ALKMQ|nr:indolepyruvate oxidoreductase subunit beta [Alkaliphilus metalliredigens]ABR47837.1 pyruvate ferredoxin/flavodoxin oxidoreductase [Alkaliphilus metalliredigens QYMF]
METKNIMLAGVGGQGLVLTTRIICDAALEEGLDVKSNDVVGLSQRGGMVWGSVRIGKSIASPNIPEGEGDILMGMEPLEAYRWRYLMKSTAIIVLNQNRVYPTPVLLEKEAYPQAEVAGLSKDFTYSEIDALEEAKKLGNDKVANTILLGMMAKHLPLSQDSWKRSLTKNVPSKAIDVNLKAFDLGFEFS